MYSRILTPIFICLFIAACDTQQPSLPIEKSIETKNSPDISRPPLDLSIENIVIEPQQDNAELFVKKKKSVEENSTLFNTLNKEKTESRINLSGKLLTDEDGFNITDPLESVEGLQINIKGKFE
jgi:hypothetical protein